MAKNVLTDVSLTVGGTDLSDHVRSVTITMSVDDIDLTAMGATAHQHAPGLRDDKIEVEFFQDFAASKVDQTLSPLVGSATGATVVVMPTSNAASSTNPKYTMVGVLLDYTPLDGAVGAASMIKATFVPSSASGSQIVRATS